MEYLELTFSIMVMANNLRAPIVISIDEDVETDQGYLTHVQQWPDAQYFKDQRVTHQLV